MIAKLILVAAAATLGLAGQSAVGKIVATVPFPFDVRGVQMAAGTYEVARADNGSHYVVRNTQTQKGIIVMPKSQSVNPKGNNALEFTRYNDTYFLTAVSTAFSGMKTALPMTKRQMEMARRAPGETVVALGR